MSFRKQVIKIHALFFPAASSGDNLDASRVMRPRSISGLFFCISAIIAISTHASQAGMITTVFDNTRLGFPAGGPTCCQIAEEITLAGTARNITQLSFPISTQNENLTAEVEAGIYLNDVNGHPGTALWHSGLMNVSLGPADTILRFVVPSIAVPDTITVSFENPTATPVALERFLPRGAPTIGVLDAVWIETSPDFWVPATPAFGFALRVDAIPEPPPLPLITMSLIIAGALHLTRRNVGRSSLRKQKALLASRPWISHD